MKRKLVFASGLLFVAIASAGLLGCATRSERPEEFDTGFTAIRTETLFSARYYESDGTLVVVRRNGDVFEYREVPAALAEQFFRAEDREGFYRDHLQGRFGESKADLSETSHAQD